MKWWSQDPDGTSTGGPSYTYVPPPAVTSIDPTSGTTAGGTAVVIKGAGFVAPATVTIGSAAANVEVVSESEIDASTTATPAGPFEVVVKDAGGNSTGGPSYTYVVPPPPPTVTSIDPTSGTTAGGTAVVIKGTGFVAPATVTIGSAATNVEVISESEIDASTTASAAGPDQVVVKDANGPSTGGPFVYLCRASPADGHEHRSDVGDDGRRYGGGDQGDRVRRSRRR